jgi:hypothetical protein
VSGTEMWNRTRSDCGQQLLDDSRHGVHHRRFHFLSEVSATSDLLSARPQKNTRRSDDAVILVAVRRFWMTRADL